MNKNAHILWIVAGVLFALNAFFNRDYSLVLVAINILGALASFALAARKWPKKG